ncbi:MAG: Ni/Fe hydrogenase subunit alpha [Anaerolineae bacterium]|nr:Ni/Fe hydrogenase subunit alpha [Anaerolineae bacterium]
MSSFDVDVHYVTRVEGHGNLRARVRDGRLEECKWEIPEAPRFFEAMIRGRPYYDAPPLTSRICGICSIGHTLASIQGIENAIGFVPGEQTLLLRTLLKHGETVQSHILHAYYLVAPDLVGAPSVVPLATSHREVVLRAVRLHRLANEWCDLIGGRTTHPNRAVVGGWTKLPSADDLRTLRQRISDALPDVEATVELFRALPVPAFERETEYLALSKPGEYAWYGGDIASTDGDVTPLSEYRRKVKEFIVPHSTAKRTRGNRSSYAVGALARVNVNYGQLSPLASRAAQALGIKPVTCNPYLNTAAQVVEVAHVMEDSLQVIDRLLDRGLREEGYAVQVRPGTGVGGVEVPRGTLYHEYTVDADGKITDANLIIPTGQNHQNIEEDLQALVLTLVGKSREEITLAMEMLVRSYDPCISCSTHLLEVEFV